MRFIPDDKKFKPTVKKQPASGNARVNPHEPSSMLPLEGLKDRLNLMNQMDGQERAKTSKKSVSIREAMEIMVEGRKKMPPQPGHTDSEMQKLGGKDGGPEPKPAQPAQGKINVLNQGPNAAPNAPQFQKEYDKQAKQRKMVEDRRPPRK